VEYVVKGKGLNKKLWTMMSPQIKITSKYQFPTITDEITTDNESINLHTDLVGAFEMQIWQSLLQKDTMMRGGITI
jgi:hypothetical protein